MKMINLQDNVQSQPQEDNDDPSFDGGDMIIEDVKN